MLSVPDNVFSNPATRVRKLLSNISRNNLALLASIESVQTKTTLRYDFEQRVDTLQSAIIATKITTTRKQRVSALTGGRVGRGGRGGRGSGGVGNHYQNKLPYNGGRGGRGARGARGSSGECVRLDDQVNPPHEIDWMEDNFYEPGFYTKFSVEQKTRLHDLRNNMSTTTPATQNVASVESRLLQLEQLASTLPPPQPIVALHQGFYQVGVQPQYTNTTNPSLQRLNQRS